MRAGAAVLAINAATRGFRPLRDRVSVTSSHIVLTEPVPDVLEAARLDRRRVHHRRAHVRALLPHHARRPDRVRLGRRPARARRAARRPRRGRSRGRGGDPRATWSTMFPALEGRAITHAWGGPIDVSPSHLPADRHARRRARALRVRLHRQRRRPVAPRRPRARLAGLGRVDRPRGRRSRARRASRRSRSPSRAECWSAVPFYVRNVLRSRAGAVDPLTRAVTAAPRALGIHVGRAELEVFTRVGARVVRTLRGGTASDRGRSARRRRRARPPVVASQVEAKAPPTRQSAVWERRERVDRARRAAG